MAKYKILTFNCNGIRDESKRRQVFNYLRMKGADIILLQEVHSIENIEKIWQNEWGGKALFSHGTSNSTGVCSL